MDGVPGVTFPGIKARETFHYRFKLRQSGTYWYHSHAILQDPAGFYAPLIIDPQGREPFSYHREYVVLLSEWIDTPPVKVLANLKKVDGYYNDHRQTLPELFAGLNAAGSPQEREAIWNERVAWARMRMDPTDATDGGSGSHRHGCLEDAEVQALYSRYVAPFWDLQLGLQRELKPRARDYRVLGVRGLAPYAFDVDLAAFVRSDGRLFARARVEYDLLFTNRLVAKPFLGVDWSARSIPADGIKAGATSSEWGVNLRHEITRAVAPYLEIGRQWQCDARGGAGTNSLRTGLRLVL